MPQTEKYEAFSFFTFSRLNTRQRITQSDSPHNIFAHIQYNKCSAGAKLSEWPHLFIASRATCLQSE